VSYGSATRYREMEVMTMSPARRIVLLYAQLLGSLRRARIHFDRKEIEQRTERLLLAQEIIHELASSLDRSAGGELAERLASLYTWLATEITSIQQRQDLGALDRVIGIVSELHEAWEGAANQVQHQGQPAA
jgi:flagellar protein FliS